ncbi:MAG: META domain-containing protein [Planctomycetota bacterium]
MNAAAGIVCLGLGLALTGCVAGPGDWDDALGRDWTLVRLDGQRPLPEHTPTLTLADDGRVAGRSGGNRFFGTYERPGPGVIRFAALGSTRVFLDDPPGLMQQEQRYLETLGQIETYHVSAERLRLLSDDRTRLIYIPSAPETPSPRAGPATP